MTDVSYDPWDGDGSTPSRRDPELYRVMFTIAAGGRRYARLGGRMAGDWREARLPSLPDLLTRLREYDDYQVKVGVGGGGYHATASIVVEGKSEADYAHALASSARIPAAYSPLDGWA